MAEVDPLTGSPLSRENRNSLFRSSTVPASTFRGTDIGAKSELVEQSKKFVEIQQQNQTVLGTIQQQFQNLQNQINLLSQGINTISGLIQKDTESEQNLLQQQQEQETRNYQRKLRIGRENELEQKIENALVEPVATLTNKVENIFGRVGSALSTLFLGWLGIQGIKALQAWRDKDNSALEEIKNNVLKNIGFGIAAVASIKLGLMAVSSALTFVIRKITGLIFNAIRLPFQIAARGARTLAGNLFGRPSAAPAAAPAAAAGRGGTVSSPGAAKPPSAPKGAKPGGIGSPWFAGGLSLFSNLLEGRGLGESATIAGGGMVGGKIGAKTGATVGSVLGPKGALVGGFAGGIAGFLGLESATKNLFDRFSGRDQDTQDKGQQYQTLPTLSSPMESMVTPPAPILPSPGDSSQTMVEPSTPMAPPPSINAEVPFTGVPPEDGEKYEPKSPMMPSETNLRLNISEKASEEKVDKSKNFYQSNFEEGSIKDDISSTLMGDKTSFESLTSAISPIVKEIDTEKYFELKPEQLESVPIKPLNIRPLEDPAPNVIVAASPQKKKIEAPGPTVKTDVPLISPSNPDNFYVLYSQLHYNVVM
jgi:hypothetical protein